MKTGRRQLNVKDFNASPALPSDSDSDGSESPRAQALRPHPPPFGGLNTTSFDVKENQTSQFLASWQRRIRAVKQKRNPIAGGRIPLHGGGDEGFEEAESPRRIVSETGRRVQEIQPDTRLEGHVADALFAYDHRHVKPDGVGGTNEVAAVPLGEQPKALARPACVEGVRFMNPDDEEYQEPLTFWGVWFIVAAATRLKRPLRRRQMVLNQVEKAKQLAKLQRTALKVQLTACDKDPKAISTRALRSWAKESAQVLLQEKSALLKPNRDQGRMKAIEAESKAQLGQYRKQRSGPKLQSMLRPSYNAGDSIRREREVRRRKQTPQTARGLSGDGMATPDADLEGQQRVLSARPHRTREEEAERRKIVSTAAKMHDGTALAGSLAKVCNAQNQSPATLAKYMFNQVDDAKKKAAVECKKGSDVLDLNVDALAGTLRDPELSTTANPRNKLSASGTTIVSGSSTWAEDYLSSSAFKSPTMLAQLGAQQSQGSFRKIKSKAQIGRLGAPLGMSPRSLEDSKCSGASGEDTNNESVNKLAVVSTKSNQRVSFSEKHKMLEEESSVVESPQTPPPRRYETHRRVALQVPQKLSLNRQLDEEELLDKPLPAAQFHPTATYPPRPPANYTSRRKFRSLTEFQFQAKIDSNTFHENALQRLNLSLERRLQSLPLKREFMLHWMHQPEDKQKGGGRREMMTEMAMAVDNQRLQDAFEQQIGLRDDWFVEFQTSIESVCVFTEVDELLQRMREHFLDASSDYLIPPMFMEIMDSIPDEKLATPSVQFLLVHAAPAYQVPYLDFREALEGRGIHYMLLGSGAGLSNNPMIAAMSSQA